MCVTRGTLNAVDGVQIALDSFLIKSQQGRRFEGKHGKRRHERIGAGNPRLFSAMIWDAGKAVSNQAKEGIGGKMLAAFGSDNRHSTPLCEGIKWFPREGYCRMEVYEKTIWISRGVLGFIALRELL